MPKLNIDLKDWGWGDWPDRIAKTTKKKKITISVEPEPSMFESVVKTIGLEMIKAFLHDTDVCVSEKGVTIFDCNGNEIAIYPWKECSLLIGSYKAASKWLEEQKQPEDE